MALIVSVEDAAAIVVARLRLMDLETKPETAIYERDYKREASKVILCSTSISNKFPTTGKFTIYLYSYIATDTLAFRTTYLAGYYRTWK